MSIHVQCGQCGKQYTAPDGWAGRRAKCPQCGAQVEIPTPISELEPASPVDDLLAQELGAGLTSPDPLASPFGPTPAAASPLGPSRRLPPRKPQTSGEPSIPGMLWALVLSQKLMVAVLLGMGFVLLWQVALLVTSGLGPGHIAGGILLVTGVVIVVGGLRGSPHRSRSKDKARATRVVGWFIVGIVGMACAFGGIVVAARQGVEIAAAVNFGMPFFAVSALVALVSALILVYYVLVLLFPKVNVFRIAGWGYVMLTVVLPLVMFAAGLLVAIDEAAKQRAVEEEAEEFQEWGSQPLAQGPLGLPPGTPAAPPSSASGERSSRPPQQGSGSASAPPGQSSGRPGRPGDARDRFGRPRGIPGPGFGPPMRPSADPSSAGAPPSGARGPGFLGSGPPDLDAQRRKLIDRYGADKVVTITVHNVPADGLREVSDKVRAAADAEGQIARSSGSLTTITVAPVDDVEALAAKLDVGKVTEVDPERRTITVDAQAAQ